MFSGDQTERYIRTFLEFWSLRPRRFMEALDRNPSRYLTPYQFFSHSLVIVFLLFVAQTALIQVLPTPTEALESQGEILFGARMST